MRVSAWRSARRAGFLASLPSSRIVQLIGMFFIPLVLVACGESSVKTARIERCRFVDEGLDVTLDRPVSGHVLEVWTADAVPIQNFILRGSDTSARVSLDWEGGARYHVRIRTPSGEPTPFLSLQAPQRADVKALLHFPYGQAEWSLVPGEGDGPPHHLSLVSGARIQMGLALTNQRDRSLRVDIAFQADEALAVDKPLSTSVELSPRSPSRLLLWNIVLPSRDGIWPLELRLRYGDDAADGSAIARAAFRVHTHDIETFRRRLRIVSRFFPTDARGRRLPEKMPDALLLTDGLWNGVSRFFGLHPMSFDPYQPFSYHTIEIENQGDEAITIVCEARVEDPETGEVVDAFIPQAFEATGGVGRITSLARIPAKRRGKAVIPFYIRRDVLEGTYVNAVDLTLLGTDVPLYRLRPRLQVRRSSARVTLALLLALPLSACGTVLFMATYRRLMRRFSIPALVTISMFSTLMFALGVGMEVLSTGFNALLGPFNIFLGGLIFEVLHHLVLATLVVVLPFPGTVALAGLTHHIMRGLMTGQFSPTDVVFLGSSLTVKELALFGFGVTRGPSFSRRLLARPRTETARLAGALSLSSASIAFISLGLHSAFFRLSFADWYVVSVVGVAALGAWPGAMTGADFGKTLLRIRE